MKARYILYSLSVLFMLVFCACERDEFENLQGDGESAAQHLVSVPSKIKILPFGCYFGDTTSVKAIDYTSAEMQIKDFWLIQFGTDGALLASVYHAPNVEGNQLTNHVQMSADHIAATKTVWIVANTGDATGLATETLKAQLSASRAIMGSTYANASDLVIFEQDGYKFTTDSESSIASLNRADGAILMSGKCSFDATDLYNPYPDSQNSTPNYEVEKNGLEVTISSMVAKLTINYDVIAPNNSSSEYTLNSIKLFRIPDRASFYGNLSGIRPAFTEYQLLPYEYTIPSDSYNSGSITLYVPQNIRPDTEHPANSDASTKTLNAPPKATYVSFCFTNTSTGTPVNVNVFPGGNNDSSPESIDTGKDNAYGCYEILSNAHYTEALTINESSLTSYLNDGLEDSRVIERIQENITSNCYILNPLTSVNATGFNYSANREEYYSLPIIARSNEAWYGIDPSKVIDEDDEWKVEVVWQDVPGRQVFFLESSGLKNWKNEYGFIENNGSDILNNSNYANEYYGRGNGENGFVNIFVKKESQNERTRGNVLIALRKKTGVDSNSGENVYGDIIWSWHLWVTDYNPDTISGSNEYYREVPGDTDNSGTRDAKVFHYKYFGTKYKWMMDRHLGAMGWRPSGLFYAPNHDDTEPEPDPIVERKVHNGVSVIVAPESFGMYYQWGRKDPFPANDLMYNTEYLDNTYEGMSTYINKYYSDEASRAEFVSRLGGYVQDLWDISGDNQLSTNGTNSILKQGATFSTIWNTVGIPTTIGSDAYTSGSVESPWGHPSAKGWPAATPDTYIVGTYAEKQGTKSLFDPCPAGWEVPESDAYSGLYGGYDTSRFTGGHYLAIGYAKVFHDADLQGMVAYGVDNRQAHINNGAWEIVVDGTLTLAERAPTYQIYGWNEEMFRQTAADNAPVTSTFFPPSGFVTSAGRKDMGGVGDVWASDVFTSGTSQNGGYIYLGRSVGSYPRPGTTEDEDDPEVQWRNSGATLYVNRSAFGFNYAFSVRCVKK